MRLRAFALLGCLYCLSQSPGAQSWSFSLRLGDGGTTPTSDLALLAALEDCPRAITLTLGQGFFVAYDVSNGSLRRVWRGGLQVEGQTDAGRAPAVRCVGPSVFLGRSDGWIVRLPSTEKDPDPPAARMRLAELSHASGAATVLLHGSVPGRKEFTIEESSELVTDTEELSRR